MDTFAKPVRMNPEMTKLLDQMRASDQPYPVYHQPPETADEQVCAVGQSLVTDANLQFATRNQRAVGDGNHFVHLRQGRSVFGFHRGIVWQEGGMSSQLPGRGQGRLPAQDTVLSSRGVGQSASWVPLPSVPAERWQSLSAVSRVKTGRRSVCYASACLRPEQPLSCLLQGVTRGVTPPGTRPASRQATF
jgi:hypothetical protein